jgi:uncharacterized protein (UPF0248 family)
MSQKIVLFKNLNDHKWEENFHTHEMTVVHKGCSNESHLGKVQVEAIHNGLVASILLMASGSGYPLHRTV